MVWPTILPKAARPGAQPEILTPAKTIQLRLARLINRSFVTRKQVAAF